MFYMALYKRICQFLTMWFYNEAKISLEVITVNWHLIGVTFIFLLILIFFSWFIASAVWSFGERGHWEIHLWSFTMCKCLSTEIITLCWTDLTGTFFLLQSVFLMILVKKTRSSWGLRKGRPRKRKPASPSLQPRKRQITHQPLLV